MTAQPEQAVAKPESPPPPEPAPEAKQSTDAPETELRCTICGLSACWTK